jgi:predicted acetyltransferase
MSDYTDLLDHENDTEIKSEKNSKIKDRNKYLARKKIEDILDEIELRHRIENIFAMNEAELYSDR